MSGNTTGFDISLAEIYLRSSIAPSNIDRRRFPAGWTTKDQVINTNRWILLLAGHIEYEVEGVRAPVRAGQWILVPNWVRRQWRVMGRTGCDMIWCEFATDFFSPGTGQLFRGRAADPAFELALFERLLSLWRGVPGDGGNWKVLQIEGEVKAGLARFFSSARAVAPTDGDSADLRPVHAEVRAALEWLEQNHARPDALDAFYEALAMSPNHFRRLFREATRSTVQEYLSRMRLRRARHLVNHTAWPLKRIAVECGYRDPLFFSRQYRRFWGHPPRADRGRKTGS